MSQEAKPKADWELIERHYRAGVLSLRQVANEGGVVESAIRKRAKRDGWVRNLNAKIQHRVNTKVVLTPQDDFSSAGFLYVIYIDSGLERIYKVGMAKRFDARFDQHQCASPFDICVALCYFVGNMRTEERSLHAAFADKRVRGEWFRLGDEDLRSIAERAVLV